jgi:hypothetical protein
MGKSDYFSTGVPLPSGTRVALEVDAEAGTLDFFVNDKQIPRRVTRVPRDVYFGVWWVGGCCVVVIFLFMSLFSFSLFFFCSFSSLSFLG